METFDNIIKKKITKIQRLDAENEYKYYSPFVIILTLENHPYKLIISATDDDSSIDIKQINEAELEILLKLEFNKYLLHELWKDDELQAFINEEIQSIRIAKFNHTEIEGTNFIIPQGKYAGVELKTENHKLLYQNNNGGWLDIDDNVMEIKNQDRWHWI